MGRRPGWMTEEDRFWEKVIIGEGCWWWIAYKNHEGYGSMWFRGEVWRAHRIAYVLLKGRIPYRMWILHTCDNPSCVNPKHLYAGTPSQNNQDKYDRGRDNRPLGESHPRCKLTKEQVQEIIKSLEPTALLAEYYKVTQGHIRKIRRGVARCHG